MTLIRKLVLVLSWVFLFTSYSNAQTTSPDLVTGNLINFGNWSGVTYASDAVVNFCCSGGPNPALNVDTNTLRFSWGFMAAAQSIALSNIFENGGTGLKVTGYNYRWLINNEGMTSGPLYGNVSLVGKNGNVLESYNYDYSRYIPGFETFSGTQKFSVDYGVPSISSLEVSFTGSDTRFWAGYYGPRVRDVNVSLNYQPDTSKPPAPITLPTITTNVDTISNTVESTALNSSTQGLPEVVQQAASTGGTVSYDGQVQQSSSSSTTAGPVQTTTQTTQAAQTQQVSPGAPAVVAAPQEKSATAGPGIGFALNLISKNSEREKAIAQQAVATSIAEAQTAGDKAQAIAISTASASVATSMSIGDTNFSGTGISIANSSSRSGAFSLVSSNQSGSFVLQQPQSQQSGTLQQQALYQLAAPVSVEQLQATQNLGVFEIQLVQRSEPEPVSQQSTFISDLANPLRDIVSPINIAPLAQDQKPAGVNRNVQPNELSAGAVLERMATQPQGFVAYTNYVLKDTAFYEVKSVYVNQRVVDNTRALRSLAGDKKHQDMIDAQYR